MTEAEILDKVEDWHSMTENDYLTLGRPTLYEFLGLTKEEYRRWVQEGDAYE